MNEKRANSERTNNKINKRINNKKFNNERIRNKVNLRDIANISSGLVLNRFDLSKSIKSNKFNESIISNNFNESSFDDLNSSEFSDRNQNSFKYYYIPQKSVFDNNIDSNTFETIVTNKKVENKYLAHYKDIIIKLTPPYNAAVVDFKRNDVIVPSNFAIIRVKDEFISVFLAYVLNGPNVKKQLRRLVEGTNIPIIKINNLKDIKIKKEVVINRLNMQSFFIYWILEKSYF
ncbi:hypothetical protein [Methanobrevibacter arboriphilus]|uniref:hypothetical protein n=1 Tax=Methanobrevibacter arboriphilus TaxID=39441 RepID=UPI0005B26D92|nr:hypothetical protein [Methanobrevibacter arboriphilus]